MIEHNYWPQWLGKVNGIKDDFWAAAGLAGSGSFSRRVIVGQKAVRAVENDLAYSPQGNRVFTELSVRENLDIAAMVLKREYGEARIDHVLSLFPQLKKLFL